MIKKRVKQLAETIFGRGIFSFLLNRYHGIRRRVYRTGRFLSRDGDASANNRPCAIRFGDTKSQFFFGYYDISPFNFDDTRLLALKRARRKDRSAGDAPVQAGYFNTAKPSEFIPFADVHTWCWQQGCRLQWFPLDSRGKNSTVIFNNLIDNRYGCCIFDIATQQTIRTHTRPVYAVSSDGRYALSLNFVRLGRLRPGYGYTNLPDDSCDRAAPADDGIWHIDMISGAARLLFSINDMAKFEPLPTMNEAEHYFNHISINPAGSRFLFFHVWLAGDRRYTRLITCNADGSDPYPLVNEGHVSHYTWLSVNELICFSTHATTGSHYHLYRDQSDIRGVIGEGVLRHDGHPSPSQCGQMLLTDTYPDRYGERQLLLFDMHNGSLIRLGSFSSPYRLRGEFRCDLHPRWSSTGRYIAFDSAHEGRRSIYTIRFLQA